MRSFKLAVSLISLVVGTQASAAQLLDLKKYNNQVLQSFVTRPDLRAGAVQGPLKEINRFTDFNHVTHIRLQQYYRNFPVWEAQAVIHVPEATKKPLAALVAPTTAKSMNGQLYQKLDADLEKAPSAVFSKAQADRATQFVIDAYKAKLPDGKRRVINKPASQLMVFVDEHQVAHWVYKITFAVPAATVGQLPAKPVYIVDAVNFKTYQQWDDIKTVGNELVTGGGYGRNPTIGRVIYDGAQNHLAAFRIKRAGNVCYLQNDEITVNDGKTEAADEVVSYACEKQDPEHNNVYWSGEFDTRNGGYSPANDAMFSAQVIKQFYKIWYDVPALVNKNGSEMVLKMVVHIPKLDNAFWDGDKMNFGDGDQLYPLTSLGIAAHEVSHGFTEQHANLTYTGQSGAMNEAFSDMAGQTAEYYGYGKNNWQIGNDVFKIADETLRYMDQPSKDCAGKEPGTFCSIDSAEQYYPGLDVHHGSGVYNRAFYLLSTAPGWDPRKAFAVMLHANASYWLAHTQFADGAACAVKAAEDLLYDANAVKQAFKTVGIDVPAACTNNGR